MMRNRVIATFVLSAFAAVAFGADVWVEAEDFIRVAAPNLACLARLCF